MNPTRTSTPNSAPSETPTKSGRQVLVFYFVFAYGLSWGIGIPLALQHAGIANFGMPYAAHYLVGFGPLLAAMLASAWEGGREGLACYLRSLARWKGGWRWGLMAVSPLLLGAVSAVLVWLFGGPLARFEDLGSVNFLPPLGWLALPLWIFTFGLGEEAGWRGFALPRLQRRYPPLQATLLLGGLWAGWHLPQFFYLFDLAILPGWLLGLLSGALVLSWMYNRSDGNVLLVVLWHGCFNFISAAQGGSGVLAAVVSSTVMVWAVWLLLRYRKDGLGQKPDHNRG